MDSWSLQDAKNKFSQVVDVAMTRGRPQIITRRGKNSAVVVAYDDYLKFIRPRRTLCESLLPDEPIGIDLDISRDQSLGREVTF